MTHVSWCAGCGSALVRISLRTSANVYQPSALGRIAVHIAPRSTTSNVSPAIVMPSPGAMGVVISNPVSSADVPDSRRHSVRSIFLHVVRRVVERLHVVPLEIALPLRHFLRPKPRLVFLAPQDLRGYVG